MLKKSIVIGLLSVLSCYSFAGIMANSSRVIYNEGVNQKSVILVNTNPYSIFTQTWVDNGEANPDFKSSPFVVVPTMFTLKPEEIKGINIIYNEMELPKDRESVFWLNLYEIPAVPRNDLKQDYLNLAMNTQIKIFYRPKKLNKLDLNTVQKELKFNWVKNSQELLLNIENPSPYYINIIGINLSNSTSHSKLNNEIENMISPFSNKSYRLENKEYINGINNILEYILIDDMGMKEKYTQNL
jgi:P pilus assembly chaperone PapD